jgi:hypothetical protein
MKVRDVAKYSGYKLKVSESDQDTLFIWVFTPATPEEVVPATWGNVFSHVTEWVK